LHLFRHHDDEPSISGHRSCFGSELDLDTGSANLSPGPVQHQAVAKTTFISLVLSQDAYFVLSWIHDGRSCPRTF
jgi:hypothetical protein